MSLGSLLLCSSGHILTVKDKCVNVTVLAGMFCDLQITLESNWVLAEVAGCDLIGCDHLCGESHNDICSVESHRSLNLFQKTTAD